MRDDRWTWNEAKSASNKVKHKLSFELAVRAFHDPFHLTIPDPFEGEERWRTYGQIGNVVVVIVHTDPLYENDELIRQGRIISARKALSHERRLFEESAYG